VLYLGLVASICAVYARREAWIVERELPGASIEDRSQVPVRPLSPDGGRVLVWVAGKAQVWDLREWRRICFFSRDLEGAALSPGGGLLLTTEGRRGHVWDLTSGVRKGSVGLVAARRIEHEGRITSFAFSPDGERVLTVSNSSKNHLYHHGPYWNIGDGTARIWSTRAGEAPRELEGGPFSHAAFSPDGARILALDYRDKEASLWDASSCERVAVLKGHSARVKHGAFSPAGDRMVTAGAEPAARMWNARTGECLLVLETHKGWVIHAAFDASGDRVLTVDRDCTPRVWDARTGRQVSLLTGGASRGGRWSFSGDGERVAATDPGAVTIWCTSSGRRLARLRPWGHGGAGPRYPAPVFSFGAFLPRDEKILTIDSDAMRIWRRRRPEWWWGHFYRPEVWAAVVFGLLWLWSVARWAWRRLRPV
jgi:WD40 repeat protein